MLHHVLRKWNEIKTAAGKLLETYKDEHDNVNLKNLNTEDFIKLKALTSKLGLPGSIKK